MERLANASVAALAARFRAAISGLVVILSCSSQGYAASPSANPLDDLLLQLVRDAVPQEYENRKKWGGTKEVVSGLHVRREGLEIRTHRRRKQVNHGDWTMYRVELADPQRDLSIELLNPRESESGNLRFDLRAIANLETFGRYAAWRYDVQLFSISALANARVRLTADCEIAMRIDPSQLPPDVLIIPHIHEARLDLLDLDLHRLSHLRGDVAEELGKGLELIVQEVLEEKRDKLTQKMNQQIAKRQDRLRFSVGDLASTRWQSLLPLLPSFSGPAATQLVAPAQP